eukprot:1603327-Prymnesium_polylepis.1
MGIIQIPRVAAAVARGYWRRSNPIDKNIGFATAHVSRRRAGPFDFDVYGHMNNAAYLVHFEMARWEVGAQSGFVDWSVRERAAFIVAGVSLRFRREIGPFQPFEVHSQFVAADDRWMYISQSMQPRGGGDVLAQSFCRAVVKKGRATVPPREVLDSNGVDSATADALASPSNLQSLRE